MWCKKCNLETNDNVCPVCGTNTVEDLPIEVYWCKNCHIPIIQSVTQVDKGICPICGKKTKYLAQDIRPVFPEEKNLLQALLKKEKNTLSEKSVWAYANRYYIDGESISISNPEYEHADADEIRAQIEGINNEDSYEFFNNNIICETV